MRIVILDSAALTGEDLNWSALDGLGEVVEYPETSADELLSRAQGAEVLLTNKVALPASALMRLPQLRYIGVTATGYEMIAMEAAITRGIVVTNAAGYGTESVAQHVFALLLALTNQIPAFHTDIQAGGWSKAGKWNYRLAPTFELQGMTLGLIGYGRIGQSVARIGRAFGMKVLAHTRRLVHVREGKWVPELSTLLQQSDVLSLHCPLTPQTLGLIHAERLQQMKPGSWLINTSRGPLIVEEDLATALQDGTLMGAGLDVLAQEPPAADHPLLGLPNCIITPHNAWGARASRQRLIDQVAANLRAFLDGRPINQVT